jgi:hypothetical protein
MAFASYHCHYALVYVANLAKAALVEAAALAGERPALATTG